MGEVNWSLFIRVLTVGRMGVVVGVTWAGRGGGCLVGKLGGMWSR